MAKMSNRGPTKRFLISEMDRSVKRMLKLIEEEGDSFAKKAEIYIQKRPELVSQVEDFYRMFRSLAERYDDATVELRRTIPSDCPTHSCGMSDVVSEPPSAITSPEHRVTRRLSGTHAAFFDIVAKQGYETSAYDSGSERDESCGNGYSNTSNYGNYRRLRRKITELESELRKIQIEQEVNKANPEVADLEEELRVAKEKIRTLEEEISDLKMKLDKYESLNNYTGSDDSVSELEEKHSDAEDEEFGQGEEDVEDAEDLIGESEMEDEVVDEMELLKAERDEFVIKLSELEEELRLKDDQIDELNERLEKLHLDCEKSSETIEELEKVVKKQREVIEEGVEERNQSESELRVSLEHYRNAYQMLRKGLLDQKKKVVAS